MIALHESKKPPTAYQQGWAAETLAQSLLEAKDYTVLAHRYRNQGGEIDIVAKRGDHLAFVEVKKRKSLVDAAYSLSAKQQARIACAAEVFLSEHVEYARCSASFDVVLVANDSYCEHIEQAFLS